MQKIQNLGQKCSQKSILGHIGKKKKSKKKSKKNFFFGQKLKIFDGINFFSQPDWRGFRLQNAVLWFFWPEKREFRPKITLIGHF